MLVWVVSFFKNGEWISTDVFKTKEVLLQVLADRGFNHKKIWFNKSLHEYHRDEEVSVQYLDTASSMTFRGELQSIYE